MSCKKSALRRPIQSKVALFRGQLPQVFNTRASNHTSNDGGFSTKALKEGRETEDKHRATGGCPLADSPCSSATGFTQPDTGENLRVWPPVTSPLPLIPPRGAPICSHSGVLEMKLCVFSHCTILFLASLVMCFLGPRYASPPESAVKLLSPLRFNSSITSSETSLPIPFPLRAINEHVRGVYDCTEPKGPVVPPVPLCFSFPLSLPCLLTSFATEPGPPPHQKER